MTTRIAFTSDTNYRGVDNVIPSIINQGEPWRIIATFDTVLGSTGFSGNIQTKEGVVSPFQFRNFQTDATAGTSQVEIYLDATTTRTFSTDFLRNGSIFLDNTQYFEIPYIEVNQNDLTTPPTTLPGDENGSQEYLNSPTYQVNVTNATTNTQVDFIIRNQGAPGEAGTASSADDVVDDLLSDPTFTASIIAGIPTATLENLSDTTITSPSNAQVLSYDSATSTWINVDEEEGIVLDLIPENDSLRGITSNAVFDGLATKLDSSARIINSEEIAKLVNVPSNTNTALGAKLDSTTRVISSEEIAKLVNVPVNTVSELDGKQDDLDAATLSRINTTNLPANTVSELDGKQDDLDAGTLSRINTTNLPDNTVSELAGKQDDLDAGTLSRINTTNLPTNTVSELAGKQDNLDAATLSRISTENLPADTIQAIADAGTGLDQATQDRISATNLPANTIQAIADAGGADSRFEDEARQVTTAVSHTYPNSNVILNAPRIRIDHRSGNTPDDIAAFNALITAFEAGNVVDNSVTLSWISTLMTDTNPNMTPTNVNFTFVVDEGTGIDILFEGFYQIVFSTGTIPFTEAGVNVVISYSASTPVQIVSTQDSYVGLRTPTLELESPDGTNHIISTNDSGQLLIGTSILGTGGGTTPRTDVEIKIAVRAAALLLGGFLALTQDTTHIGLRERWPDPLGTFGTSGDVYFYDTNANAWFTADTGGTEIISFS